MYIYMYMQIYIDIFIYIYLHIYIHIYITCDCSRFLLTTCNVLRQQEKVCVGCWRGGEGRGGEGIGEGDREKQLKKESG